MPAGIPVGTLAIGKAGATNAALLAAAVLALTDAELADRLDAWRAAPDRQGRRRMPDGRRREPARGSTIGILGGGQLGRMLALAAARLGLPHRHPRAAGRQPGLRRSPTARSSPPMTTRRRSPNWRRSRRRHLRIRERAGRRPPARLPRKRRRSIRRRKALAVAQDRLAEKPFLNGIGIPTARFPRRRQRRPSSTAALSRVRRQRRAEDPPHGL